MFVVHPRPEHEHEHEHEHAHEDEKKKEEDKEHVIFCFVYKYRCRFALVAGKIFAAMIKQNNVGKNGELDDQGKEAVKNVTAMMDLYKDKGMLVTDLSGATCGTVGSCGDSC